MAGSFYRAPAPGEPAFCKEGDKVTKGQTVCIIEAMKLMNEIEVLYIGFYDNWLSLPAVLGKLTYHFALFGACHLWPVCVFLSLQADVSGTIVKWLVDNGSQITPGQVCQYSCKHSLVRPFHVLLYILRASCISYCCIALLPLSYAVICAVHSTTAET